MLNMIILVFGLGTTEIILIVLVVLLLFGGRKIPELMRGVGKGVKSFKDGIAGMDEDLKEKDKSKKPADKKDAPKNPAG
ncbi:MAG: twin-arginine translocase TatA/TatE family subunit [Bacteroidales bacterium]|nr:twin-arginine translocase TatA/TatE family subunit [Bacteroidota bacterium]MBL6950742.1 twin-arginine translocase TatA/TatE family subunit [Bacteroidales bacterium]